MAEPVPAIQARAVDASSAQGDPGEQAMLQRLDAFGESLSKKRSAAIKARAASGIEDVWLSDEEQYEGIDEANRDEVRGGGSAWKTRPAGMEQPSATAAGEVQSKIFPNITQPFCDMAAGRFADMVVPADESNFELVPPPIPDLDDIADGKVPPELEQHLNANVTDPAQQQKVRQNVQAQAQAMLADANAAAQKAQDRVETWLQGCGFHAEIRSTIDDVVDIGTGIIKGPVPVRRRAVTIKDVGPDGAPGDQPPGGVLHQLLGHVKRSLRLVAPVQKQIVIDEKIEPASYNVSPWNCYPDYPACGENIHNGSFHWECDSISRKKLDDLKGGQGDAAYLDTQIDRVLKEGPAKNVAELDRAKQARDSSRKDDPDSFQIWWFYGTADHTDMTAAGCECKEGDLVPVMVTMVNAHVIKCSMNMLDSGEYPYDYMPLKKRKGMPWGTGLARMLRTPQRMLVAGSRRLSDNLGLAAGAQYVASSDISPINGSYVLTANKGWRLKKGSDIQDVRQALQFFEIPSRREDLIAFIQLALNFSERVTGMPVLLQGQLGESRNQPLGVVTIQNNNGNALLRRMAKLFDDRITSPHISRYYKFLLQYGENDEEKRNLQVEARGSSALIERQLQSQELPQMFQLACNPLSGLDPKKTARELVMSRNFDPSRFEYDDDQWKQIVQNMSQKGGDPRVAVAQLKAAMDEKLKTLDLQFQQQEGDKNRQVQVLHDQILERVEAMKDQGAKEISFDELRAMLAKTVITVNAQKEVSAATIGSELHRHHNPVPPEIVPPPVQVPGRAGNGQTFAQTNVRRGRGGRRA